MRVFLKEISFSIFLFLISLSIFFIFLNDFGFLNLFLYSLLCFFIYLLLSKRLKNYKISKITVIVSIMFLISFYSFNIYNFFYKKPSAFIEKLIHTKDKENLNEYVNKVLSQKENSEIFDFFDKENFKYYKNNGNTYFYFKGVILGKRYSIAIELNDNNVVKNIYIFTGYNAY